MRSTTNAETDCTTQLAEVSAYPWRVKSLRFVKHGTLNVTFADGMSGDVIFSPTHFRGVFAPLAEPAFFSQAYIDHGAVTWPNEADLAPDAMYEEIRRHGRWVLQ